MYSTCRRMIPGTTLFLLLSACLLISFVAALADGDDAYSEPSLRIRGQSAKRPLKVFLLAGQSNMVGMGSMKHLDLLVQDPDADPEYRDTLWNGTSYRERDDVWIRYTTFKHDQHGKLRPGSGFGGKNSFGPELMFGWTVGDALVDEPVLLIKTAWGGKDLAIDFRPPASGQGSFGKVKPIKYGWLYRQMITDVLDTLGNISAYVPGYKEEHGYELIGFVWFQGWNDMLDMKKVEEYGPNLANFIRDVRLDLEAPDLPFVVGELGMHGVNLTNPAKVKARILGMRAAEHSVTLMDEFRNNTLFVRTAPYAVLNSTKYNGIYHYFGRADTMFHIGQAFGRGMLQLMGYRSNERTKYERRSWTDLVFATK